MANPFDQFDAPAAANPFDQFDTPAAPLSKPAVDTPAPTSRPLHQTAAAPILSLVDNQIAGMQRTSPIVRGLEGEMNYKPLGELVESSDGPLGLAISGGPEFDPKLHVALRDPQSGKLMVYERNADMREGKISSLGRVLGPGTMVSAPTRLPGGAGAAPAGQMAGRVQDMVEAGVTPRLAPAADSKTLSTVENVLSRIPGAEGIFRRGATKNVEQMAARADEVAGGFGKASDPVAAGRAVDRGLSGPEGFISRFQQKAGQLFDEVGRAVPQDQPFDMPGTAAALTGITGKFPTNPELGKTLVPATFQRWASALESGGGKLTWPEIKELRTFVGKQLNGAPIGDVTQGDWKQLYAALSKDLEGIASASGPRAKAAFDRSNAYYAAGRDRIDGTLKSVIGADTPEAAYAEIMRSAQAKGGSADIGQLRALRRSLNPDEWGDVASAVIHQMGRPLPGAADPSAAVQFSPARFVTEYAKMSPEARLVIFSDDNLRGSLDQLVRVAGYQKNVDKLTNTSNTASQLTQVGLGAGMVAEPTTALLTLAGTTSGAALMNYAPFVRWVAQAGKFKGGYDVVDHLGRLRPIIQTAPQELRPAIRAFAERVREQSGSDETPPQQ